VVDQGGTKRRVDRPHHSQQCALPLYLHGAGGVLQNTRAFPVTAVNLAGVRFLGEVEFWFSSIKVISLIGLILFGILVDAGVNPGHQTIGFRYFRPPYGPFGSYLEDRVGPGGTSRFLGVCSVMSE
jgi:amino acid permease